MITVYDNIQIPDRWDDLTPQQAMDTMQLLSEFSKGNMSLQGFRLLLLQKLTGYTPSPKKLKKFTNDELEQVRENLYMLSEYLKFPIRPRIDPEILDVLSDGLRQELKTSFPEDITNPEWVSELKMVEKIIKIKPEINLNISKCLIPEIEVNGVVYHGPVFNIDNNGVVKTDMLAAEYIDANEFYNLYVKDQEDYYLDCFIAALYRTDRKRYSTYETQVRADSFSQGTIPQKGVVLVWFQSLLEYMADRSPFSILFTRKSTGDSSFNLGIGDTIYSIAGKGYGSKSEVEHFPIQDYFMVLLRELVTAVRDMKDMKITMSDIEKKTGLSADVITQL